MVEAVVEALGDDEAHRPADDAAVERLHAQLESMSEEVDALGGELAQAKSVQDDVVQERDGLLHERERLLANRDHILNQLRVTKVRRGAAEADLLRRATRWPC